MTSKYLVAPNLVPSLEQMPSFEATADSLPEMRSSLSELRVPAPETTVEERPQACYFLIIFGNVFT